MSAQPPVPADRKLTTVEVSEALARLDRIRADIAKAEPVPASPPFSFKGWLFSVWLVRNKGAVKMLLVVFLAWLTALFAAVEPPELKALLVGAVGFVSKFGLDLLDYWLTPQPEPPGQAG